MNRYKCLVVLFFVIILCNKTQVKAGTYDNAYSFYCKYGMNNEPAYMNRDDGYIYFCSWGNKSISETKYKTVGYSISVDIDGNVDTIEVKLGGSIIKDVSTVTHNSITYVLRRARLSRLQELFNGNKNITWYQIFRKDNVFSFDAIMTVVEKGKDLCGNVKESSNMRKLSADNEKYMYRKLSGIKNARNWSNPSDLNNFYNRVVQVCSVSPLVLNPILISGRNIYYNDNLWYVKQNSKFSLSLMAKFNDIEAASKRYHPNYNVYRFDGWGDDCKYAVMHSTNNSYTAKKITDGNTNKKPVTLIGVNSDTNNKNSYFEFYSMVDFYNNVPDSEKINVVPEGRIYYDRQYPQTESESRNLCDVQSNLKGKTTIVSDGKNPEITVPKSIQGYQNSYYSAAGTVTDNGAGLLVVRLFRNDGTMLFEKYFSEYCNYYSIAKDYSLKANSSYSYYLYAMDNVGNESCSTSYYFSLPKAHVITGTVSGGMNGFNAGDIDINVFGGNSEINAFLIMSEDYDNPSNDRVIIENKSVEAHTMKSGLYQFNYKNNIMSMLKNMPDGEYYFDVISGGRYISCTPFRFMIKKDLTPPEIRTIESGKSSCGWYKTKANITMDIYDYYSRVSTFDLECDGEYKEGTITYDSVYDRYLKKYEITSDGINKIRFSATDFAGNKGSVQLQVKIDSFPPSYRLYGGFVGADFYQERWINKKQFNGGIVIQDFQSGLLVNKSDTPIMIKTDGGWMKFAEQNYSLVQDDYNRAEIIFNTSYTKNIKSSKNSYWIYVKDRVGNILSKVIYVNVDCDAPVISYATDNSWDKEKLKGNIIAFDNHSGIAAVKIKCNDDIVKCIEQEGSNSLCFEVDLNKYKNKIKKASIELEDMVGNLAEYPLEFIIPDTVMLRTRIR